MANFRTIVAFFVCALFFASISAKSFILKWRSLMKSKLNLTKIENIEKTLRGIQRIVPVTEKCLVGKNEDSLDSLLVKKRKEIFEKIRKALIDSMSGNEKPASFLNFDWYLEKFIVLKNWKLSFPQSKFVRDFQIGFVRHFSKQYCAIMPPHRIKNIAAYYRLKCDHRICLDCIESYLAPRLPTDNSVICCHICKTFFRFDIAGYVYPDPKKEEGNQAVFNKMPNLFYCRDSKAAYKKCNTNLCENIIAITFSNNCNINFYFKIECADGHVQCAYCGCSFDHSPLDCRMMLSTNPSEFLIWKKDFLKDLPLADSKDCKKCNRKMSLIDPSKLKDREVLKFLQEASIFICPNCKHIEANNTAPSSNPFHNALLLFEKSSKEQNSLLYEHCESLKSGYLFLLMILQPMDAEDEDEKNPLNLIFEQPISNKQYCVKLFLRLLDFFQQDIEAFSLQSGNSNLLADTCGLLKRLIDSPVARIECHSDKFDSVLALDMIFEYFQIDRVSNVEKLSRDEVKEHLKIFFGKLKRPKQIRPSFEALQQNEDPLKSAFNSLKTEIDSTERITNAFKNSTGRSILDADVYRMIRICHLNHNDVLRHLEERLDDFLDECNIKRLKECAVCCKLFRASENAIPECNHDPMCKECLKSALDAQHKNIYVTAPNGLLKCFQEKCKEVFHPFVMKRIFGENSEQWNRFEKYLQHIFETTFEDEKLIQCPSCKKFFQIDKKSDSEKRHNSLFNASYAKKHKMLLQTFECPNCSYSMCVNCKQKDLHFSTVCGKSLDSELANWATMCPGCKKYGSRAPDCPEMTCLTCTAKFCFACGVCEKFTDCINTTYPGAHYSGNFNIRKIDAYHAQVKDALNPVLAKFNKEKTDIIQIFESPLELNSEHSNRLATILKKACLFRNWHILLLNYIEKSSLAENKGIIGNYLTSIETHSKLAISQLKSSDQDSCVKNCKNVVSAMKMLDDLVHTLPISNMILLTENQYKEYEIEAEKFNQEEKNAALPLEQLPVQVDQALINELDEEVGEQLQPSGSAAPNDLREEQGANI